MHASIFLKIAYVANIFILVPVCWSMLAGRGVNGVFEGVVNESAGLRIMTGSLWTAILVASIAGLWFSRFFAPVLLIQILYKAMWLAIFVAPLIIAGKPWPQAIAICFALIVMIYPFLFWFGFVTAEA